MPDTEPLQIAETVRGFAFTEGVDRYDVKWSIQKSSLATEDCIWFGVDNADPQIMVSDAVKLGLDIGDREICGWMQYEVPKEVLMKTRMHLTREMVAQMLPILQRFVDTGEIYDA